MLVMENKAFYVYCAFLRFLLLSNNINFKMAIKFSDLQYMTVEAQFEILLEEFEFSLYSLSHTRTYTNTPYVRCASMARRGIYLK